MLGLQNSTALTFCLSVYLMPEAIIQIILNSETSELDPVSQVIKLSAVKRMA